MFGSYYWVDSSIGVDNYSDRGNCYHFLDAQYYIICCPMECGLPEKLFGFVILNQLVCCSSQSDYDKKN